jgi:hypothetical protein
MGMAYPVGELFTILTAYLCMNNLTDGNWRLLVGIAAVPGFFQFLSTYFMVF